LDSLVVDIQLNHGLHFFSLTGIEPGMDIGSIRMSIPLLLSLVGDAEL
jgi:hypothetical protein